MATKIQKIENTGVVYADPSDPGLSVRFKQTDQGKSLSGVPVTNHVTEIIINDDNTVAIGGQNAIDAVSVRIRVSGTAHSKARIRQLLAIAAQSQQWSDEDVFQGYRPVTAPIVGA